MGDHTIAGLSNDAKAVAASFFPHLPSRVTFHMVECRPGARCQAGLDELVAAGLVTKEPIEGGAGAAEYNAVADLSECHKWQMQRLLSGELDKDSFKLWEKIPVPAF